MKTSLAFLTLLTALLVRGCCSAPAHIEPTAPTEPLGWMATEENGVRILGKFLLHRGETTSNGKIQVRVLEILPGDGCAESASYLQNASAKLQFLRLSDQQVLCEARLYEHQSGDVKCGQALSEFDVLGISINAINLNEGWVFFELLD
ncbi:MAG TPA: hypothetical protein VGK82_04285 [Pyrinomonadaceae bacterium]